jgi:hypothetical protein
VWAVIDQMSKDENFLALMQGSAEDLLKPYCEWYCPYQESVNEFHAR